MIDPKSGETRQPEAQKPQPTSACEVVPSQPDAVKKLTPEEQMALFEQELKENDWGHQPC